MELKHHGDAARRGQISHFKTGNRRILWINTQMGRQPGFLSTAVFSLSHLTVIICDDLASHGAAADDVGLCLSRTPA